jgi:hypothetical protein
MAFGGMFHSTVGVWKNMHKQVFVYMPLDDQFIVRGFGDTRTSAGSNTPLHIVCFSLLCQRTKDMCRCRVDGQNIGEIGCPLVRTRGLFGKVSMEHIVLQWHRGRWHATY